MIVIPRQNQNLLDIALQYLGDANQAYAIAEMNGINISDDLATIDTLTLSDTIINAKAVAFWIENNRIPASKYEYPPMIPVLGTDNPGEMIETDDGKLIAE
jgi:hypothetical protein